MGSFTQENTGTLTVLLIVPVIVPQKHTHTVVNTRGKQKRCV